MNRHLRRFIGMLPVSMNTFGAESKRRKESAKAQEKRLLAKMGKSERRLAEIVSELDLIRDRVTSLLEDASSSRLPIYRDAARALARSIRNMESLPSGQAIKVAFITDSGYALPTAVAISSLLRHREASSNYEIYVVGSGLSEGDKSIFAPFGPAVRLVEIGNKYADKFAKHHHVHEVALLKFDLPTILGDFDKILYLDGDILVLDDLAEIWDTPLEGQMAAVVKDYWYTVRGFGNMLGHAAYFNSGVMLLNAGLLRRERVLGKLIEAKETEPVSSFMDQTAFNMVFGANVKYLPPKFNMLQTSLRAHSDGNFRKISEFYGIDEGQFERMFENPAILHLAGKYKPWQSRFAPSLEIWQDESRIFREFQQISSGAPR